ncbi:glyoxalase superfamily protein [Agrobacterium rosae]|uniref:glyoxalase superfamily protein n=1 Tax=Agrobacterium rosae TaxID=1972867 RepID=UPI00387B5115
MASNHRSWPRQERWRPHPKPDRRSRYYGSAPGKNGSVLRGTQQLAKALRQALSDRKIDRSHSDHLELLAKQFGVKDWNALAAGAGQDSGDKPLLFSVMAMR